MNRIVILHYRTCNFLPSNLWKETSLSQSRSAHEVMMDTSLLNSHVLFKNENVFYSLFSSFFKLFTLPDHCTGAEPSLPFAPYPGQVLYSVRKWCIRDLLHFSVLFIHCDGVDSARYLAHKDT